MNKFVLYVLAAMLLVALVVACGGGASPTSAPPTAAPAQPTTAPAQPTQAPAAAGTKLQLLGWSASDVENDTLKQVIANWNGSQQAFAASFEPSPNYDQSLQTALAGGQPPDVFYVDSLKFPDFIKNGVLAEPPAGAIENPYDFYPSLRQAFTADGKFYCPPKDFSTLALIYNKKMFSDAGVAVPTNWDELAAAAKKVDRFRQGHVWSVAVGGCCALARVLVSSGRCSGWYGWQDEYQHAGSESSARLLYRLVG